jgi:hypothetical protein
MPETAIYSSGGDPERGTGIDPDKLRRFLSTASGTLKTVLPPPRNHHLKTSAPENKFPTIGSILKAYKKKSFFFIKDAVLFVHFIQSIHFIHSMFKSLKTL